MKALVCVIRYELALAIVERIEKLLDASLLDELKFVKAGWVYIYMSI